jgi:hypothetical protein
MIVMIAATWGGASTELQATMRFGKSCWKKRPIYKVETLCYTSNVTSGGSKGVIF